MNFKHLYYFWKVAGGVARASRELHITPHTISGQIKRLEESLSARLFVREGLLDPLLTFALQPVSRCTS
jgi:LysR family transcriptional activator of nhaA